MSHKATPEQWERMEKWRGNGDTNADCVLELRDRIAALEAAANSSAGLTGSPAPAGGLVERVAAAIKAMPSNTNLDWKPEAATAILAVADVMESRNWFPAACWLREEVERG
jgi:hypothetical protein